METTIVHCGCIASVVMVWGGAEGSCNMTKGFVFVVSPTGLKPKP